jgi:imidazoleglycerol-phosphate dehydratase
MSAQPAGEPSSLRARVALGDTGRANVSTGLPVLDRLLELLAAHASFELSLEVAAGAPEAELAAAGRAFGEALWEPLRGENVRGHGSASVPADEALAHVALEASGRPRLVSNVDLSAERIGGLRVDVVSGFLNELAHGAGLTLHVRLLHGDDPTHVLEAIFKSLGVALAQAWRPKAARKER